MQKIKNNLNLKFLPLLLLLILLIISSCSTTKEIQKDKEKEKEIVKVITKDSFEVINFRKNINSLFCSGDIEFANRSQNMSGTFEMKIIRDKAVLMDLFGPFGINVARVYSTKDTLMLYNLWSGKYYQTSGSLEGFEFISPFVSKLFSIIIAEPFYDKDSVFLKTPADDSLYFNKKVTNNEKFSFKYIRPNKSMNFLSYNYDSSRFEVYFRTFEKKENYYLPTKIDIYDQTEKNQLKLKIDEIKDINSIKEINNNHKSKFTKVKKIEDLF